MKYTSENSYNKKLIDTMGREISGVIEFDDETKLTKLILRSHSGSPIMINSVKDGQQWEMATVVVALPGARMVNNLEGLSDTLENE
jgi:hypothetical protein